jgi:hypothetical protein
MRIIPKQITSVYLVTILVLLLSVAVTQAITYQGAPQLINYQGRLTDGAGTPLSDGPHSVQFRIWDDTTLTGGPHLLWDSGPLVVTTDKGIFTVKLGTPPQPSLGLNNFNDTSIYLGITVGADPEIAPRTRLTSVPFAMSAQYATSANTAGTANFLTPSSAPAGGTVDVTLAATTSTTPVTLGQFTVTAPGPGWLMVNASGYMYMDVDSHSSSAVTTFFYIGLCDAPNSSGACGQTWISIYVQDADNTDIWNTTPAFSLNESFYVPAAGLYTYYLNGATRLSTEYLSPWSPAHVNVLFVPTGLTLTSPTPANPGQKPQKQE